MKIKIENEQFEAIKKLTDVIEELDRQHSEFHKELDKKMQKAHDNLWAHLHTTYNVERGKFYLNAEHKDIGVFILSDDVPPMPQPLPVRIEVVESEFDDEADDDSITTH
jgi:biotin-(acetyl-CoA carboxylase) ligase